MFLTAWTLRSGQDEVSNDFSLQCWLLTQLKCQWVYKGIKSGTIKPVCQKIPCELQLSLRLEMTEVELRPLVGPSSSTPSCFSTMNILHHNFTHKLATTADTERSFRCRVQHYTTPGPCRCAVGTSEAPPSVLVENLRNCPSIGMRREAPANVSRLKHQWLHPS